MIGLERGERTTRRAADIAIHRARKIAEHLQARLCGLHLIERRAGVTVRVC